MQQLMRNGKTYEFESVKEREERLEVTALSIYEIIKNDNLNISDYNRTIEKLDFIVKNNTFIGFQPSV